MSDKYTLKNLKTFEGHDGMGFNATLYRGSKRVAKLHDAADGGMMSIYWEDRQEPKVPFTFVNWQKKECTINVFPEEAALRAFLKDKVFTCPYTGENHPMDIDIYLSELVDAHRNDKRLRKLCRDHIIVRTDKSEDDEMYTFKLPYSADALEKVKKRLALNGEKVIEVINERY